MCVVLNDTLEIMLSAHCFRKLFTKKPLIYQKFVTEHVHIFILVYTYKCMCIYMHILKKAYNFVRRKGSSSALTLCIGS